MRIEAYTQVQQLYKPKQTIRNQQAGAAYRSADQLQLSTAGRDFQIAKSAVAAVPDVREDRVAAIKAKIDNGTYQVDTSAFADRLLSRFDEMR